MNQKNHSSDKGFKQTEVGVIPEDWDATQISVITSEVGDGIHSTPIYSSNGEHYFINGNNLVDGKIVTTQDTKRAAYSEFKKHKKNLGDRTILLSINGTIGNLGLYAGEPVILGKSAAYLNVKKEISKRYIYFFLQTECVKQFFEDGLTGTTIKNLGLGTIRKTPIALPKYKKEQTAIATALSDADALIQSLEKLIAKKRNIKQGAMQKCLNCDSCDLEDDPDFGEIKENHKNHNNHKNHSSDKWEVKKLGEIFSFSGGYTASREQLSDDGFCYLHYGDIHGANKTFINVKSDYAKIPKLQIPLKKVSPKSLLNDGDIVFVDASEDDEGTSRHIVVKNPSGVPYISGLHTIVAKSKDDSVNDDYKRYCFQSAYIKGQFKFYAVGTKVSGISKTNIAKIEISLPPLSEQTRIATILSDMDTEVSSLEIKLAKYKQVKQGMMQELLTGKTRLV